ncbi:MULTISPECIES: helix-turn-helix domain-containing protein [unclassified Frankia]|uniref:helix-turn-helix domain-containing protein n=1 Tax=unclassified Frankia TaxID=2632575 RepID=UPI0020247A1F
MLHFISPAGDAEIAFARPHPRLRPGVHLYRGHRMHLLRPRRKLEIPVSAVTLVLGFAEELRVSGVGEGVAVDSYASFLAGLQTRAKIVENSRSLYAVEVVLMPWVAFTLFGVAMHEVAERVVDPGDLLGGGVRDLTGALAALPDWEQRFALLDTVLAQWIDRGPVHSPRVVWAWQQLIRTGGTIPIARLAAGTGWGRRQLENRFREQIGLSPKAAARVLRLRRALRLLATGTAPVQIAATCGFSDQAHFAREFKAMTGSTPRRFLTDRNAAPVGPGPWERWDRMPGEVTSVMLSTGLPA